MMKKKLSALLLVFAMLVAMAACEDHSGGSTGRGANGFNVQNATGEAPQDTADDQLAGNAIGDSVTIGGVTLTVVSIEDGPADAKSETWKVHVVYVNQGGKMLTVSPYDWLTVLPDGSEKQYDVDDKGNFDFATMAEEKIFEGDILLFKEGDPTEIKYVPTQPWTDKVPTWKIP